MSVAPPGLACGVLLETQCSRTGLLICRPSGAMALSSLSASLQLPLIGLATYSAAPGSS